MALTNFHRNFGIVIGDLLTLRRATIIMRSVEEIHSAEACVTTRRNLAEFGHRMERASCFPRGTDQVITLTVTYNKRSQKIYGRTCW